MNRPKGTSKNYRLDEAADRKPAHDHSFSHVHGTDAPVFRGAPNIIIVMSDQQRWDTLGCRPQVTPRLDQLAAGGTLFRNAFTPQPLCGPARACIQTGTYASRTGCYSNNIPLPTEADTMAKRTRGAGYDTAYFGKWHLGSSNLDDHFRPTPPERRGGFLDRWQAVEVPEFTSNSTGGYLFDESGRRVAFSGYRTDAMTDLALDYLDSRADNPRPFLLFLSFVEPHPQSYRKNHYGGPKIPDRNGLLRDYIRYEGPDRYRDTYALATPPKDLQAIPGDWEVAFADYLAACRGVDDNVGRILDALRSSGKEQNTLTVFTSDHGNHFHTRNDNDGKCSCHDASIRIPLIAKGPGFGEGEIREEFASLIDIAPTVLHAAGLGVPEGMDGDPDGSDMREAHLYDLSIDPHQLNNLVDDLRVSSERARLRQRLAERIRSVERIDCSIAERA